MALITITKACEYLDVSRTTLYGLCRAGIIKTVPIGVRGKRIPESEIERFIRERLGESKGVPDHA